jgi:hypothetical protein
LQGVAVNELAVIATHARHRRGCWWGGVCDLPERVIVPQALAAGFHIVSSRRLGAFTIIRFRAAQAVVARYHWRDVLALHNRLQFVLLLESARRSG